MRASNQGARRLMEFQRENRNVGKAGAERVPGASRPNAGSLECADIGGGVDNSGKIGNNDEVVHGKVGKVSGIRSLASAEVRATHIGPTCTTIHTHEDMTQSVLAGNGETGERGVDGAARWVVGIYGEGRHVADWMLGLSRNWGKGSATGSHIGCDEDITAIGSGINHSWLIRRNTE